MCSIYNIGYHYADEHFQIIPFAGLKLGIHSVNELAWEYDSKVRSALQPSLAVLVLNTLDFFEMSNPYNQATILRLLTSLLSLFTITMTLKSFIKEINQFLLKKIFIILSLFLWFLPYINVRFMSETWSGSILLIALSLIIFNKNRISILGSNTSDLFLIGLVLGLSFLFRYQIGIIIFGIFLSILIGILIDFWFYEQLTFSSINYFKINIIDDVASNIGIQPWGYYFNEVLLKSILPIEIIIITSSIYFFVRFPKNIITWTVLPFFIIHSLIPHKELRFL